MRYRLGVRYSWDSLIPCAEVTRDDVGRSADGITWHPAVVKRFYGWSPAHALSRATRWRDKRESPGA